MRVRIFSNLSLTSVDIRRLSIISCRASSAIAIGEHAALPALRVVSSHSRSCFESFVVAMSYASLHCSLKWYVSLRQVFKQENPTRSLLRHQCCDGCPQQAVKLLLRNQRGMGPLEVEMLPHGTLHLANMAVGCIVPDPAWAIDSLSVGGEWVTGTCRSLIPLAWWTVSNFVRKRCVLAKILEN